MRILTDSSNQLVIEDTLERAPAAIEAKYELFINRLVYALNFAHDAIQHLIIEENSATEDAPWYVKPEKIIAETGYLLVFAKNCIQYEPVNTAVKALAEILIPLARSKAMLLNICIKPSLALDYAHAHICLKHMGYPNHQFDEALKEAMESNVANGIERTPYRMLERTWLQNLWNNHPNGKEIQFWTELSCLNNPSDLFSESNSSVYALTHAVMYATYTEDISPPIDASNILSLTEGYLARYIDEQDYDIAGELLMIWPLLNKPMNKAAAFALDCITNIDNRVGFLPAPNLDLSMIEGKERSERRTYIYSINYHTVLVMGLLCSSLLTHKESLKTVTNTGKTETSPHLNAWLDMELIKGKQPHWLEYYHKRSIPQKADLASWSYQVLIARYVRDKQYKKLKKILNLGKESNLSNLEMHKQAENLLIRLKHVVEK